MGGRFGCAHPASAAHRSVRRQWHDLLRHRFPARTAWVLDTWVMSCRVLGRQVEEAVLNEIAVAARAGGVAQLVGLYRPTPRNGLVRDHYDKLGFARMLHEGEERWILDVAIRTRGLAHHLAKSRAGMRPARCARVLLLALSTLWFAIGGGVALTASRADGGSTSA